MKEINSRQSFLGPKSIEEFDGQTIGIIGLCGGGSHIAQQLAHIGFRHFMLCDFDYVEDSNLTRMIGSCPNDAIEAKKKIEVISRTIKNINPNVRAETFDGRWQSYADSLRSCSVIFGCVDSLSARDELEKFCRRFLIPYIDIGMDVHATVAGFSISGQVAMSLPDEPCLRCMGILRDADLAIEHAKYGAAGGKPQVVWPNGILASTAISQFMTLILRWSSDQKSELLIEYDGNRHTTCESSRSQYLKNMECTHFKPGESLGDPFF